MTAIAVALAATSAAIAFALHAVEPAAFDFTALYAAARLVATGNGPSLTDPAALLAAEHAAFPERVAYLNDPNLPVVALLMAPLALLSPAAAYVVMLALSAIALAVAAVLLAQRATTGAAVAWVLLAPPSILALAHGQLTPFVLAALLLAERRGPAGAGLLLSAVVLRPQLLPLAAIVATRERTRFAWFAAGCVVAAALSVAVARDGILRYPALLAYAAREIGNNEVGVGPLILRILRVEDPAPLNVLISAVVLAFGAAVVLRARRERAIGVAGTWSTLGAPHALMHDLLFAYPAVAEARGRARSVLVALGVGAVIVQLAGVPLAPLWLASVAAVAMRRSDRLAGP